METGGSGTVEGISPAILREIENENPAKGCLIALALVAPFWVAVGLLIAYVVSHR
jgi:hypothetical protein